MPGTLGINMPGIHRKKAAVLLLIERIMEFGSSLWAFLFKTKQFGIANLTLDNVTYKQLV